jgi:hypothetical protein
MINQDTRLLMVCPTRSRPDRVLNLLESFQATKSDGTEIIVVTSQDDPRIEDYKISLEGCNHYIHDNRWHPSKMNHVTTKLYPGLAYYGQVDDDHIFRTPGWDASFIEEIEKNGGWGLACGNDLLTPDWKVHRHPSGTVMSGNVVRTLGYFTNPRFQHIGVDTWQRDLFESIGKLFFIPEVVIEHMHAHVGKAEIDAQYKELYAEGDFNAGINTHRNWKATCKEDEVTKLREAMRI